MTGYLMKKAANVLNVGNTPNQMTRKVEKPPVKAAKPEASQSVLLKKQLDESQRKLNESERKLDESWRKLEESRRSNGRLEEMVSRLQHESGRMEARHGETCELLKARTAELRGAQLFLTTADKLSGAEVSQMVEKLNGEIHQAAAFMAESFEFQESKVGPEDDSTNARGVTKLLGPTMLKLLGLVRHWEDSLVVQIALQACMTNFAD